MAWNENMFERVMAFLRDLPGTDGPRPNADDPRVAAAALMYHVMDADGVRQDVEWGRLKQLLGGEYQISGDELDQLVQAGRDADSEAVDLYSFTSVLLRHLEEEQRTHFVRMLWDIAYADGVVHELEDNTLWRIAELLGVDRRDRIAARQSAAEEAQASDYSSGND